MTDTGLSAAGMVGLAERGAHADAAGRGRLLLAAARPGWSAAAFDSATLGMREASAVALRRATFGDTFPARGRCPACGTEVAVTIPAERLDAGVAAHAAVVRVEVGGYTVRAHPPDGPTLAAAAAWPDEEGARAGLLEGCVEAAAGPSGPVAATDLPEAVVAAVGEALVGADPSSELRVPLSCVACGRDWEALVDAARFVWEEIDVVAQRLLDEVHTLALAYHWTESEVLALSAGRRRQYIERVTA